MEHLINNCYKFTNNSLEHTELVNENKYLVLEGPISLNYYSNVNNDVNDKIKILIFGEDHSNPNLCKNLYNSFPVCKSNEVCMNILNLYEKIINSNICIDSILEDRFIPNQFLKIGGGKKNKFRYIDKLRIKYFSKNPKWNVFSNRLHDIDIRQSVNNLNKTSIFVDFIFQNENQLKNNIKIYYNKNKNININTLQFIDLFNNYFLEFNQMSKQDLNSVENYIKFFIKKKPNNYLSFKNHKFIKYKIKKQINNINFKLFSKKQLIDWYNNRKNQVYLQYSSNLRAYILNITVLLVDIFAIARMFRIYKNKINKPLGNCTISKNPDFNKAKNIIVYVGESHKENYIDFIKNVLNKTPSINYEKKILTYKINKKSKKNEVISCLRIPLFKPFGIDLTK